MRRLWEWRAMTSALLCVSWLVLFTGVMLDRLWPFEEIALAIYLVALLSSVNDQGRAFRRGMEVAHANHWSVISEMGDELARQVQDAANGTLERQGSELRVGLTPLEDPEAPGQYL